MQKTIGTEKLPFDFNLFCEVLEIHEGGQSAADPSHYDANLERDLFGTRTFRRVNRAEARPLVPPLDFDRQFARNFHALVGEKLGWIHTNQAILGTPEYFSQF